MLAGAVALGEGVDVCGTHAMIKSAASETRLTLDPFILIPP